MSAAMWLERPPARRRTGVKGPRAGALLGELGVEVPAAPNGWAPLGSGEGVGIVARLGNTEFFLEQDGDAPLCAALESRCAAGVVGAYPVLREDVEFVLGGAAAPQALAEVCNVDFTPVAADRPIYLTLMIGVAVLVVPQTRADGRIFRIWCDPTFGSYLQEALETVVHRIHSGRAS